MVMSSEAQPVIDEHPTHDNQAGISVDSSQLSTGQKKRKRVGPSRGHSRGLKYAKLRRSQPQRIPVSIPEEWCTAVGEGAQQFVIECSQWVKEICPLNVERWDKMPEDVTHRLYDRIKSNYELPEGNHVMRALEKQCSGLYRKWRERLKRQFFKPSKSLTEVEQRCPSYIDKEQWKWLIYNYWSSSKQRERSEKNRVNALALKIHSGTGPKSIARVANEMEANADTSEVTGSLDEPKYIQLWKKTKGNQRGELNEEGEKILGKFKDLHSQVIETMEIDGLSVWDAYEMVLGHSSGHARGLGRGHIVPSNKEKYWRSELQRLQKRVKELGAEIERKKREAKEREELMKAEIGKKERETKEREKQMQTAILNMKKQIAEREAKMRAYIETKLFQTFRQFTGADVDSDKTSSLIA